MRKEVAKESIKFEAKFTTYKNESGFKIIAGIAYAADTGDRICTVSYTHLDVYKRQVLK